MGKLRTFIMNQDMFGHQININFNKNGNSHGSAIGGFFSIILRLMMLFYVFMIIKKMALNEGDTNFTQNDILDVNTAGAVNYLEAEVNIFHVLYKQKDRVNVYLTEELKKYIEIKYQYVKADRDQVEQNEEIVLKYPQDNVI